MKKLLILLLLFIFSMFSFKIVALAIPQTIDYEVSYYEGFMYDLNDGVLKTDAGFISTSMLPLFNYPTGFVNGNFHHILFWDSQNNFLGYYNTDKTSIQTSFYLGDILNDEIVKPQNASKMAFMGNYAGTIKYPQFNNMTLDEVFENTSNYVLHNTFIDEHLTNTDLYTSINRLTYDTTQGSFMTSGLEGTFYLNMTPSPKYYNNLLYVIYGRKLTTQYTPSFRLFYDSTAKITINATYSKDNNDFFPLAYQYTGTMQAYNNIRLNHLFIDTIRMYDFTPWITLFGFNQTTITFYMRDYTRYRLNDSNIYHDMFYNNKPSNMSDLEYETWYEVYSSLGDDYPIQISKEEFMQIAPFYLYNVETPEEAVNFTTILDNMFNIQGFSGSFVKMIISAIIIGGAVFMLAMYKAGGLLILGVAAIIYTGLAIIGWLPQAPILIMGLGLLALIILKFVKGGGGSDEE